MNDEASSDGSSAAGPALPAGVLKTRTAWAGDELEMDHTREQIRRGADDEVDHQATHAAVDISQFHNKEVGSGYQARHVVRQKTGPGSDGIKVRGLTGGTSSFGETEGRGEKMESDKKKKKKAKKTKKIIQCLRSERGIPMITMTSIEWQISIYNVKVCENSG